MLAVSGLSFGRYGLAVGLFVVAAALHKVTSAQLQTPPFFLLAIVISSWLAGWLPGLICAALASGVTVGTIAGDPITLPAAISASLWTCAYLCIPILFGAIDASRRSAHAHLRERDTRLQLVGEQIPASLWSTDSTLRLTSGFGAGFAVLHGDQTRTIFQHYKTRDRSASPIAAHLKALEGISSSFETTWKGRTFQSHVEPLRNLGGQVVGVVGVALDITERKLHEDDLQQAKAAAEAAAGAKDRFLAMLSHELRTPLTPVLAATSALEARDDLPPALRQDLEMIRRNVELEARLIDDLLDLTRIAKGKLGLVLRPIDAHEVLRNAIDVCREDLKRHHVQLVLQFRATRRLVHADAARLQQVCWNLVKNAIKFSPQGGALAVRTADTPTGLRIEVSDTGIGIDPELLPRIFNPFEQGASQITRQFGGLGMGLAISKALVEAHGGKISADSAGRGRGSTFIVHLNASIAAPLAESQTPPMPSQPAPAPAHTSALTLLLVEDHEDTRRMLARLLRDLGHTVRTAGSLAAALSLLDSDESIDLLLSDIDLPDGSGLDLMRSAASRHHIKGIALTGYGMEIDHARTTAAGFARHLTKPIDLPTLEAAIHEVAATLPNSPCANYSA